MKTTMPREEKRVCIVRVGAPARELGSVVGVCRV